MSKEDFQLKKIINAQNCLFYMFWLVEIWTFDSLSLANIDYF